MKPALPLTISHAAMNAACGNGDAIPLSSTITRLIRHQGSWWVVCVGGWLRITDELTAAAIGDHSARMSSTAAGPEQERPCPPRRC